MSQAPTPLSSLTHMSFEFERHLSKVTISMRPERDDADAMTSRPALEGSGSGMEDYSLHHRRF